MMWSIPTTAGYHLSVGYVGIDRGRDIAALTKWFGRGIGERELRTATAVVGGIRAPCDT